MSLEIVIDFGQIGIAVLIFAGLGAILGAIIGICAKAFYVKPDTRVEEITKLLPGANCGACGFPGCSGLAQSIVENNTSPVFCKSLKDEKAVAIAEVLKNYEEKNNN